MSFENLNLHPLILKAINDAGYTTPTPIQEQAIPALLAGQDVMASAQTGTGKTAAFMLPALHRLAEPSQVPGRGPRVLVLTPTRELALQVSEAAAKYGKHLPRVRVVSILGGMPYPLQNKLLSQPVDILVATPGRLIDHIQRGRIQFSRLEMMVLDEADRMLDMGFWPDVQRILGALPAKRQTLLFSATMPAEVLKLTHEFLQQPRLVQVGRRGGPAQTISHAVQEVPAREKTQWLAQWIRDESHGPVLVFCRTKIGAERLASRLSSMGIRTAALHADRTQQQRMAAVEGFRTGTYPVLVATDVAARGLDIEGIAHVVNYEVPDTPEAYVHRVGRTGRAESTGSALTLVAPEEVRALRALEKAVGVQLQ